MRQRISGSLFDENGSILGALPEVRPPRVDRRRSKPVEVSRAAVGTVHMAGERVRGSIKFPKLWANIQQPPPLHSPANPARFSAFWLRSKCSICSYQLNL